MKIKFVEQVHKRGCGVACAAMVLGKTYEEIAKDFHLDFDEDCLTTEQLMDYLGEAGFSIIYKEITHYFEKDFARKEMLKPFAPVHIVVGKWKFNTTWHAFVMDAKGKFICPDKNTELVEDYYIISEVIGLYK